MSQPPTRRSAGETWPPSGRALRRNRFGLISLGLAVLGFATGWVRGLVPVAVAFGAAAVLFGVLGCVRIGRGEATNTAVTVAGLALGAGVAAVSLIAVYA